MLADMSLWWETTRSSAADVWKFLKDGWKDFWKNIKIGAANAINSVISAVEKGINWCIDALNSLSWDVPEWVPWVGGKSFGLDIPRVALGRIELFANGGFPDMGQMFVAREAGPELVGSINGRAAVANNDQIVAAVSEGVYNAVVAAMRGAATGSAQNVNVYLDGKQIYNSVKRAESERGRSLMGNQLGYTY